MTDTLREYRALLEQRLANAEKADPNDAPFGMSNEQASAYHSGRATAYQHALEMLPTPPVPPHCNPLLKRDINNGSRS